MKVGFIGAGRMAQRRLLNLPADCEPVAVYDKPGARVNVDLARDRMEELHVTFSDDVIEQSDLVIVATTHSTLAEYAHRVVDAGKQVFVEKPGGDPGDDLAPGRYGFNHRFWPGIMEAQRQITGPVMHVRGLYGHGNADRLWRMDHTLLGGGELIDQGSHLIDLTRFLCGDVFLGDVMLRKEWWPSDNEDTAVFWLETEGGAVASHMVSWCEWAPVFRFELITENEKITVDGFPWANQELHVTERDGSPRQTDVLVMGQAHWHHDHSLRLELEDAIAGGPDGATEDDALAVLRVVEDAYA